MSDCYSEKMKIVFACGGISNKNSHQYQNLFLPLKKLNQYTQLYDYSKHKLFFTKKTLNDNFCRYVLTKSPDVLLVAICDSILYPHTFFELKKKLPNIILVAFFTDDNWLFNIFSKYWQQHFDLVVTIHKPNVEKYRALGKKAIWFRWSGNVDVYKKIDLIKEYDVTFV